MPNYQSTRQPVAQQKNVNYLSKDFDSIKRDLIDYLRRYYPDDYQDFNEASGGMAIVELLAYLGDAMSFFIDRQVNEGFIDRAIEPENIFSLAQNLGYRPRFSTPAIVNLSLSATFTDSTSASTAFSLKKGSKVVTNFEPAIQFETLVDADFSRPENRVTTKLSETTTQYSITSVSAMAGSTRVFTFNVGSQSIPFLTVQLPDREISEIVSVTSSNNKEYFQVDNLAQGSIFTGFKNSTSSSASAEYILQYKKIPYRFITQIDADGQTSLVFGGGTTDLEDSELIPNPEDFVLPASLRGSPSGFSPAVVDSSNFLKTKGLGYAPRDELIDIKYRFGGGLDTNVGPRTLKRFVSRIIQFGDQNFINNNQTVADDVLASLLVENVEQASGGSDTETNTSIKENAAAFFNSQNRAVTLQDYQVRIMSMPSEFGSVYRSYARKDPANALGVELICISRNAQGFLEQPAGVLKNNIETYLNRFKSFSDTVKITDGKICNIGVDFTIVPEPTVNNNDALLDCFILLRGLLITENTNFGGILTVSNFMSRLQALEKIRSVVNLEFTNIFEDDGTRTYSSFDFDIKANTQSGILYFPEDVCWELKYPNFDIVGRTA